MLFYVNMEYTLENINIHKPCQYPLLFLIIITEQLLTGSLFVEGEVNEGGRKEGNKVLGAGDGSVLQCPHGFCEDLLSPTVRWWLSTTCTSAPSFGIHRLLNTHNTYKLTLAHTHHLQKITKSF